MLETIRDSRAWAVVLFLLLAVVTGIVGNRSDAAFLRVWSAARSRVIAVPLWLLTAITGATCVLCIVGLVYAVAWPTALLAIAGGIGLAAAIWRLPRAGREELRIAELEQRLQASRKLADVGNSLLRLLPSLGMSGQIDTAAKNIIEQFLADCIRALGQKAFRAVIYLPSENDPEQLIAGPSQGMIDSHMAKVGFHTGNDRNRVKGIAGHVFQVGGLHIIRFNEEDGKIVPDTFREHYHEFDAERANLPYRSFVAIALPLGGTSANRYGVLCFDSAYQDSFDDEGIRKHALPGMAEQAVAVIAIWRELAAAQASRHGTNGTVAPPTDGG